MLDCRDYCVQGFSYRLFQIIRLSGIIVDPIRPGFPGTVRVFWVPKNSVPMSRRISFGKPNVPGFSKPEKYDISDIACEYCDFPTVGGNRLQE